MFFNDREFRPFGRHLFFGNDLGTLMLLMSRIMTYLSHSFEFEVKKKIVSVHGQIFQLFQINILISSSSCVRCYVEYFPYTSVDLYCQSPKTTMKYKTS